MLGTIGARTTPCMTIAPSPKCSWPEPMASPRSATGCAAVWVLEEWTSSCCCTCLCGTSACAETAFVSVNNAGHVNQPIHVEWHIALNLGPALCCCQCKIVCWMGQCHSPCARRRVVAHCKSHPAPVCVLAKTWMWIPDYSPGSLEN